MEYREYPAPVEVEGLVRCLWTLTGDGRTADAEPALPDGSPELIVNLGDPFLHRDAAGLSRTQPAAFLVGQISGPFHVRPTGRVALVAARLEAHGATALAADLRPLCDTWIDLSTHPVLEELRRAAKDAAPLELALRLGVLLPGLLLQGRQADWRVAAAVGRIRASGGAEDVGDIAAALRCSPRTLQRLFQRDVGITPKALARIVRFQRVFGAWREDPHSLARVAGECGYSDHSHLVRDFRELAGMPPASFLANQPAFSRFFTG